MNIVLYTYLCKYTSEGDSVCVCVLVCVFSLALFDCVLTCLRRCAYVLCMRMFCVFVCFTPFCLPCATHSTIPQTHQHDRDVCLCVLNNPRNSDSPANEADVDEEFIDFSAYSVRKNDRLM